MKKLITVTFYFFCLSILSTAQAELRLNLLESTPVGSWQLREEIRTNKKGRQTGSIIKTSMVGEENRNGERHYWIENSIQDFKVSKKGKRKNTGDKVIMKSLIAASLFEQDPANLMKNLRGMGVEVIIQSGNEAPMRMADTGAMMEGLAKIADMEISHDFSEQGTETIETAAGSFDARKIYGEGDVEMKVLFKKMHMQSKSTMWISNKVPFGTVKLEIESLTNGKNPMQTSGTLVEYGMSGASSEISGEVQDAPEMPKLGDIFGG